MKAAEILKKHEYLVRVETDSSIMENPAIRAMREYAKDQIEKDRERVKANLKDGLLILQHKAIINHIPIILD